MKKSLVVLMLAAFLMASLLSGCERPASQAPVSAPTQSGAKGLPTATLAIPFPVATEPNSIKNILSATQTAMAMQQKEATPTVALPTLPVSPSLPVPPLVTFPVPVGGEPPTVTPLPPVVLPTAVRPETWTLMKGEHPYCLARRFNVDIATLLSINGLSNTSNSLPVGRVIKIPLNTTWNTANGARPLRAHPAVYTAKSGDTIYSVACYFGDVDPMAIAANNNLAAPYTLTPGQKLNIP